MDDLFQELLACHTMLRTLGFAADDIYVAPEQGGIAKIVLRTQQKEFVINVGRQTMTNEDFSAEWPKIADRWNHELTDEQRNDILNGSRIRQRAVELIAALVARGFEIKGSRKGDAHEES